MWREDLGRTLNTEHGGVKRKAEDELEEERPAKRASPSLNIPEESRDEKARMWLASEQKVEKMEGKGNKRSIDRYIFIASLVRRLQIEIIVENQRDKNRQSEIRDALNKTYRELPGLDFDDEEDTCTDQMITDRFAEICQRTESRRIPGLRVSNWDLLL